jgi:hypothetical protein
MSVSVYVKGIRDNDEKLQEMVSVKIQCDNLKLSYPPELTEYLGDAINRRTPEDIIRAATEVDLRYDLRITMGSVEQGQGMTINLADIPDDITTLRIHMG